MATTYSWVIAGLECYPEHEGEANVVCTVHWRRQATDGTHMADVYGSQALTLDPDAEFVTFDDLTPAIVEDWLEKAMGEERVVALDDALDKQIANIINPPIVSQPLPWAV
jgi:hypothetical protein